MNSIRIVYARCSDVIDDYVNDVAPRLLSQMEYARLCKYENKSDRQLSLLGKLLLFLEVENLGIPLKDLTGLTYYGFGKPGLNLRDANVQFSISHSGTIAIVAISLGQRVGIDIEHIERIDVPEPASVFTPEEQHWVRGDTRRFLTLWTRKEAVLKAEGKGLSHDLHKIDVIKNATTIDGQVFHVQNVEVSADYACAMAFEKKDSTLILSHVEVDHLFLERISNRLL
jgi:4'-phosphopantetheinyl transferase